MQITSGQATVCTFVNVFIPRGAISIAKITEGGTGTASFLVTPTTGPPTSHRLVATTATPGAPADAKPMSTSDTTDSLRLGTYRIVEQPPLTDSGEWSLISVICDGVAIPFEQGRADVTPTRSDPHLHCVFTDSFSTKPTPPIPPNPKPGPGPAPDYQVSDLAVTKVASAPDVRRGGVATFHITVKNLGPDAAEDVVLADQPRGTASVVSVHPSSGSCRTGPPIVCRLGTLDAGASVNITVRMRVSTNAPTFTNRAVVGTSTLERKLANNVAHARIGVAAPPPPPRVTG